MAQPTVPTHGTRIFQIAERGLPVFPYPIPQDTSQSFPQPCSRVPYERAPPQRGGGVRAHRRLAERAADAGARGQDRGVRGEAPHGSHAVPARRARRHRLRHQWGKFMRAASGNSSTGAAEIGGHIPTPADTIVPRPFGPIARIIWPHDTEAFVASVMRRDVRTARRWISGEIDAPAHVWAVMFAIATNPNRTMRND